MIEVVVLIATVCSTEAGMCTAPLVWLKTNLEIAICLEIGPIAEIVDNLLKGLTFTS